MSDDLLDSVSFHHIPVWARHALAYVVDIFTQRVVSDKIVKVHCGVIGRKEQDPTDHHLVLRGITLIDGQLLHELVDIVNVYTLSLSANLPP